VLIPESQGGSGLSLLDAALVSWSLGHAVTPSPFLSSSVMAPVALAHLEAAEADAWLGGISTGDLVFGVAATETFSIREGAGVALRGGTLTGKTLMALDAVDADLVLIAAGPDMLAVVRRDDVGITTTRLTTIDATRCTAELVLDGVAPEAVFEDCDEAVSRMLDAGRIALAADALGAAESMIAQAVAYALERKQFDRVIGSFQAVKHMCAEMIAELEPARSLLWYAAHAYDALPDEAPLMACHVLAHASEIGREIASVATQVHGGIGWTDEQNLHFWFKRIANDRHLLGGPAMLRERAAALQGYAAAS
jgi:alkylation response protein AidB-like acyl-CoA dehydrogenase